MWCQHANGERTNNRCDRFRNKLRREVLIVHTNPFLAVQILRRIDDGSTNAFEMHLSDDRVKRTRRRTTELEHKLCDVIERFNASRDVATKTLSGQHFSGQFGVLLSQENDTEKHFFTVTLHV